MIEQWLPVSMVFNQNSSTPDMTGNYGCAHLRGSSDGDTECREEPLPIINCVT